MARRDSIPPYELMRGSATPPGDAESTPSTAPSQASASASRKGSHAGGAEAEGRDASPWWVGSSAPMVLRLPKGLLVGLVVGLAVLLALAYWVGYSRGNANLDTRLKQALAERDRATARGFRSPPGPAPDQPGGGGANHGQARAGGGKVPGPMSEDPRQPGLNYMVLATYPPDAAQRLARLLAEQGVETYLDPLNNGKFVHVVAVGRGVKGGERDSPAWRAFTKRLRAAGRAWKRSNGGRGDDLNTMYPDLYSGP